jgi:hypothetical protein
VTSAVAATVQAILALPAVAAICKDRTWPVIAPQQAGYPHNVVHRVSEADELLLAGHSGLREARVSVESRALTFTAAEQLGEVVQAGLKDIHLGNFAGFTVSFAKHATDYSDYADASQVYRRIQDFIVRFS